MMLFLITGGGTMADPWFNKEMDEYLSKRRKNKPVVIIKKKKKEKKKEEIKESEPVEEGTISEEGRTIRKPFLARIFPFLFRVKKEEVIEEILEEEAVEDTKEEKTKELLKAMHKWLNRLPPRAIREFKESKDYELYKEVLAMYGLIKTEEE
ncbi:hypothetical protein J7K74_00295 [Candidatus Woesearchaeota archaeon]|nr:hypothetical protein [Candidatus Woesearchaeota archaeon]